MSSDRVVRLTRTLLALSAALFLLGCSETDRASEKSGSVSTDQKAELSEVQSPPVVVTVIQPQGAAYLHSYSEVCRGVREAKIDAKRPGRIVELTGGLGESVRVGQVILRLDSELEALAVVSAQAGLELAQTELEKAKLDHERSARLRSDSLISKSRMELVEIALRGATANSRRAEAALGLAQKNLLEANIAAPIDGEITLLPYEKGETPAIGSVVAEVVDRSSLLVDLFVPESELSKIRVGAAALVRSTLYPDVPFHGVVNSISPKASERTKLFQVEVGFENTGLSLRSGMSVTVSLESELSHDAVVVPHSALVERAGALYAPIVDGAKLTLKKVIIGSRFGANVTLDSGLHSGDLLIVRGAGGLADGAAIRVVEEVPLDSLLD